MMCKCGRNDWKMEYEWVPWGSTYTPMPVGEVCRHCLDDRSNTCDTCGELLKECVCEDDIEEDE